MFKKKVKPSQLSAMFVVDSNNDLNKITDAVDMFCKYDPSYLPHSEVLKDELQYFNVVGGLIAVSKVSDDKYAIDALDGYIDCLRKIDDHNKGKTPFKDEYLLELKDKLLRYLNGYFKFRNWNPEAPGDKRFDMSLGNTSFIVVDICTENGTTMSYDEIGILTFTLLKDLTYKYISKFDKLKIVD